MKTTAWERYKEKTKEELTWAVARAQKWPPVLIPSRGKTIIGREAWERFLRSASSDEIDAAHRVLFERAKFPSAKTQRGLDKGVGKNTTGGEKWTSPGKLLF